MWKSKRRDDDLTRRFDKNRKVRETEVFVSGHWDPNQDVWTGLCDGLKYFSSKSVASITLRNGDETLFSCLGIVIERNGCLTRFLTSAKLAITCKDFKNKLHDGLKIEVCLEGTKVHNGFLALSAVEYDFAVIEVYAYLDVHVVLEHALDILPHGEEVLAVGRGSSGQLMARTVNFSGDLRASEGDGDLDCIVQQAWEGGPLFSFNGNFVGMSLNPTTRRALILS